MQFPILISLKPVVLNLNVESPGGIFKNADAQESFCSQGWEALPNQLVPSAGPWNLECWASYFPLIKPPGYPGILSSSLHGWKGEKWIRDILI